MKPQTKEEVLACLNESIENGKKIVQIIATADERINGGDPKFAEEVLKNKHRIRLLKCYTEEEGEDSPGFLELYYDRNEEGVESLLISFNVKPDPDPEKCEWNTYKTPYENLDNMADILSQLQQEYYDNEMFGGTVWEWKNTDLNGKLFEVNIKEEK